MSGRWLGPGWRPGWLGEHRKERQAAALLCLKQCLSSSQTPPRPARRAGSAAGRPRRPRPTSSTRSRRSRTNSARGRTRSPPPPPRSSRCPPPPRPGHRRAARLAAACRERCRLGGAARAQAQEVRHRKERQAGRSLSLKQCLFFTETPPFPWRCCRLIGPEPAQFARQPGGAAAAADGWVDGGDAGLGPKRQAGQAAVDVGGEQSTAFALCFWLPFRCLSVNIHCLCLDFVAKALPAPSCFHCCPSSRKGIPFQCGLSFVVV